jgi:hypothetical protein
MVENSIIPLGIPPDSWIILQPLDLVLFGVTIRSLSKANRLGSCSIQSKYFSMPLLSFTAAAAPQNIIKNLRHAGICPKINSGSLFCLVHGERCRLFRVVGVACDLGVERNGIGMVCSRVAPLEIPNSSTALPSQTRSLHPVWDAILRLATIGTSHVLAVKLGELFSQEGQLQPE